MRQDQLPDGVRLEEGNGGLPKLVVEHDAASAEIYLHGAHVTAWTPRGRTPVLWVSPLSPFVPSKPIRGGVPICFPWFGARASDPAAPAHGLVRLASWTLDRAERGPAATRIELVLGSAEVPAHGLLWSARYVVEVGEMLTLRLEVANDGDAPLTYEEALHTYYAVGDAREATVSGLVGTEYLDKPTGMSRRRQDDEYVRFGDEVDRVYLATPPTTVIHDPVWKRQIRIENEHSDATVVWNPGPVRAAAMSEVGEGWPEFVCVETCNVAAHAVTLAPAARHTMTARIAVL